MKIKTSKLIGPALDWAVTKALKKPILKPLKDAEIDGKLPYDFDLVYDIHNWKDVLDIMNDRPTRCDCTAIELMDFAEKLGYYILNKTRIQPWSTSWALFGPVIEQNFIHISHNYNGQWDSFMWRGKDIRTTGETPLIAATRCFVSNELGDEIEIPNELK